MNRQNPSRGPHITAWIRRKRPRVEPAEPQRVEPAEAKRSDAGRDPSAQTSPPGGEPDDTATALKALRAELADAERALSGLDTERSRLREARQALQAELGGQHGKRVIPRLKVEKTNGTPSLVIGQRMMQRIFNGAGEYDRPIDQVAATLSEPAGLRAFTASHGVPASADGPDDDEGGVIVHAFKGTVGLVELRREGRVRHLEPDGADPGEIRAAAVYDESIEAPAGFDEICRLSAVLSAHVPRPYVQIFWVPGEDGPAVSRIDVDPDRLPSLTAEWDLRLGRLFDTGHARMLLQPHHAGALLNRVPGGTFSYQEPL